MNTQNSPIEYEIIGDIELPDEEAALINAQITQAEKDISNTRINFRWGSKQLSVIKKVASKMGVPYQTYIKQALLRQAMQDLAQFETLESHLQT